MLLRLFVPGFLSANALHFYALKVQKSGLKQEETFYLIVLIEHPLYPKTGMGPHHHHNVTTYSVNPEDNGHIPNLD